VPKKLWSLFSGKKFYPVVAALLAEGMNTFMQANHS
jgi:hypothetical protein